MRGQSEEDSTREENQQIIIVYIEIYTFNNILKERGTNKIRSSLTHKK
jgi:hypothetical protein